MDPTINLMEQLALSNKLLNMDMTHEELTEHAMELAELVIALDEWRQDGGFDPYGVALGDPDKGYAGTD